MQNEHHVSVMSVENATRRFYDLPIPPTFQISWLRSAVRMVGKLLYMLKYSCDQLMRGLWVM
jgi:hypothetical protein